MPDAALAGRIRLLVLDVDGVLTDNGIYLGVVNGQRVEFKRFDIQDGLGLALLRESPIEVAWLSARPSEATTLRATELRIGACVQDPDGRKLAAMERLLAERALTWEAVAFVGDDLADLPVLRRVGLPIAVANAVEEVKDLAHWITSHAGGHGAVREVVERLLRARGEYDGAVARYLEQRGDAA
jgi:3-deoxy-D-manno-octulosonate 8-phosphate phosphatase (KDO 8-P phosphatase)